MNKLFKLVEEKSKLVKKILLEKIPNAIDTNTLWIHVWSDDTFQTECRHGDNINKKLHRIRYYSTEDVLEYIIEDVETGKIINQNNL